MDHATHLALGLDRILNASSKARSNSGTVSASLPENGLSPCADTGTAGVSDLRLNPTYERFIAKLYDLMRDDRFDEAHDLVRAEHRAIHGRS